MTNKELIQIIKRFPKTAQVVVNGQDPKITASVNQDGEWTITFNENENSTN